MLPPHAPPPQPLHPIRRWQPLTGAEWNALLPFMLVQGRPGRPLKDARRRMDAVFWIVAAGSARRTVPPRHGKAGTTGRHFAAFPTPACGNACSRPSRGRARSWPRSTGSSAPAAAPPASGAFASSCSPAACPSVRRCARPPGWLLPDPDLSEYVRRRVSGVRERVSREGFRAVPPGLSGAYTKLLAAAGRRIPRCLEPL